MPDATLNENKTPQRDRENVTAVWTLTEDDQVGERYRVAAGQHHFGFDVDGNDGGGTVTFQFQEESVPFWSDVGGSEGKSTKVVDLPDGWVRPRIAGASTPSQPVWFQ